MHRILTCLAFALAVLPCAAQRADEDSPTRTRWHRVAVPLHAGRLHLPEFVDAVLESYGFGGEALRVPDVRIDLRGARGLLYLTAARAALLDTTRFRRRSHELVVTVDRARAREARRDLRARLVGWVETLTSEDLGQREYELALAQAPDTERPMVVLVHGVESGPRVWHELSAALERDLPGVQLATFAYPNDEAIERVAVELAKRVAALPHPRIAIVAHSLGGLIARGAIEDAAIAPGNVVSLTMIGTPNHGSRLAGLRFALEIAAIVDPRGDGDSFGRALVEGLRASLLDGLGEAGGDLLPDSVALTKLNARAKNDAVTYRLVLGTRAPLTRERLGAIQRSLDGSLGDAAAAELLRPKLSAWLGDLDELVDGAGDGAVSVARGRLDEVETVLVPLDHVGLVRRRGILGRIGDDEEHPVFAQVARWLAADLERR